MIRSFIWIVIVLFLAFSCLEEPDCVNLKNNYVGVRFKNLAGDDNPVAFTRITASNAVGDLRTGGDAISSIRVPLNYNTDSTLVVFETADTTYRALFRYKAQPQYVSEECGNRFVFGDLQVPKEKQSFDSVRLINSTPVDTLALGVIHVEFYFN